MKQSLVRLFRLVGFISIFCAIVLLAQHYNPNRLSFSYNSAKNVSNQPQKGNEPVALIIPGLAIHLPIIPTEIKNKKWQTTDLGVSYLKSSAVPGEQGNSIFYGHNWNSLLGNLVHIKSGQQLTIVFADGSKKKFRVQYIGVVSPSQESILKDTTDKRVTLYTCTGFLDSKRFVVVANLSG